VDHTARRNADMAGYLLLLLLQIVAMLIIVCGK
jgi:hypothetical protein